jgi:YfiR/HmsC-like
LILSLSLILTVPRPASGDLTSREYFLKANFIANFLKFVDWPDTAFSSPSTPLLLCVYGYFPFGTSLAENALKSTVHERRIEVRMVREEQELRLCHVVFVSQEAAKHYNKVLGAVRDASILTIGETPDFLDAGGTVTLFFQAERVQFDVNLRNANQSRIKISSRLLAMARHVVGNEAKVGG